MILLECTVPRNDYSKYFIRNTYGSQSFQSKVFKRQFQWFEFCISAAWLQLSKQMWEAPSQAAGARCEGPGGRTSHRAPPARRRLVPRLLAHSTTPIPQRVSGDKVGEEPKGKPSATHLSMWGHSERPKEITCMQVHHWYTSGVYQEIWGMESWKI